MGTDIHMFAEKKIDGVWTPIKGENINLKWYRETLEEHKNKGKDASYWENVIKEYESEGDTLNCIYNGRSYDTFAILADVRNGKGFAGVKTGDGFNPISQPKGLPYDVSEEVKNESDYWDGDGHSHSWISLKELQNYDWNQTTSKTGMVGESEYAHYKNTGKPDSWSDDVSGGGVVHLTNEQMDSLIKNNYYIEDIHAYTIFEVRCVEEGIEHNPLKNPHVSIRDKTKSYYTRIYWQIEYIEYSQHFYDTVIPKLKAHDDGSGESVRLVFWFDN